MGIRKIDGVEGIRAVIENEMASAGQNFLVWQWYWTDGRTATAPHVAKLHQLISLLSGHGSAGTSILIYTSVEEGGHASARKDLTAFLTTFQPILQQSLNDAIKR